MPQVRGCVYVLTFCSTYGLRLGPSNEGWQKSGPLSQSVVGDPPWDLVIGPPVLTAG